MFLTALEGGADEFDVFPIDVVWAPEFARAGWLADLSAAFPPAQLLRRFLPRAVPARARLSPRPRRGGDACGQDLGGAVVRRRRAAVLPDRPGAARSAHVRGARGARARRHAPRSVAVRMALARAAVRRAELRRVRGHLGTRRRGVLRRAHPPGHAGGNRRALAAPWSDPRWAVAARRRLLGGGGDAARLPGRPRRLPAQLALRLGGDAARRIAGARQGGLGIAADAARISRRRRAGRMAARRQRAFSA